VRGLADCHGLVSGCVMVWGAELLVALLWDLVVRVIDWLVQQYYVSWYKVFDIVSLRLGFKGRGDTISSRRIFFNFCRGLRPAWLSYGSLSILKFW
jgi:hypothetical protein